MTTETTPSSKPTRLAPFLSAESKFFWDAADQEQFVGQKCGQCGRYDFPPRPMCPDCHSVDRRIVPLSGKGTVLSWTMPLHPPAFGFKVPPIVAVIRLEENINFVSNLVGIAMEEVSTGLAVEVAFEATMNNHKVPVFKPVVS